MNYSDENSCEYYRELLDAGLDREARLTDQQSAMANEHREVCTACDSWYKQISNIVDAAMVMPQFDVAENLTQSILSEVQKEESARRNPLSLVLYSLAVLGGVYLFVLVDPYETLWGLASWIVGLLLMFGVKLLIEDPTGKEVAL